ncbi:MAG: DUF2339 domain-containing protein [Planctomycetes bacterium]|nr:DUF2339 domain-containing protein [Planctomycetota bacterium]
MAAPPMEELLVVAALGLVALLLVGTVVAFLAYARASGMRRDVDRLKNELAGLRRELAHAGEQASTARAPTAPSETKSAPVAGSAPGEWSSQAAVAPARAVESARGLEPDSTRAPEPARAPVPVAPLAPATSEPKPSAIAPATPPARSLPPPVPARPPAAPKKRVPIERILGVTVAAVLGGVFLAIGGYLLYQHSVAQGWVTKEVRLAMGIVTGVLAVLGSHPLKKRGYDVTANALAGGGIVVLYAAFWAAHQVFGVWPVGWSFALMVANTAFCAWLSMRRNSQVVAAIGLLGGFATPIALSTGADNPIGLFGYTLLVNLGFLSVAHKQRWPATALIAFLGTFVIEALWIFTKLRGETFWIGLVALGLFAVLFAGFVALQPDAERRRFVASQIGALLAPFLFAIYFAARQDDVVGYHLAPIAVLAALVLAAAGWIAVKQDQAFAPLGATVGSVAVVLAWVLSKDIELERAWELAACSAVLALVLHGVLELARRRRGELHDALVGSSAVLALGLSVAMFLAAWKNDGVGFAPWCAGGTLLALVCARTAVLARPEQDDARSRFEWLGWAGAVPPSMALVAWTLTNPTALGPWISEAPLVWALVLAAALQLAWFVARDERGRRALAHGTAIALAGGLVAWQLPATQVSEGVVLAATGGLFAAAALASTARRAHATGWLAASAVLLAFGQSDLLQTHVHSLSPANAMLAVLVLALGAGLHTGAVALPWLHSRMLGRVRAASAWLWLPALSNACEVWGGEHAKGVAALILAGLVFAGGRLNARAEGAELAVDGLLSRFLSKGASTARTPRANALTWSHATALALAAFAVTLALDQEPGVVAAVLSGAGLAWLARRERHLPLAIVACAVLVSGALGLLGDRIAVTKPVYPNALWNWLLWLYLVPGIACVFAAKELKAFGDAASKLPRVLSGIAAIGAVLLVFAWIHLAILNAFGASPSFQWHAERESSRDLTLSLAWALYAFALLVLGVSRKSSGLRWISLILFLVTVVKTFLFDLGHLTGLYRVGSFFGLAVTLLAVSLCYQRFVFRREPNDGERPPAA